MRFHLLPVAAVALGVAAVSIAAPLDDRARDDAKFAALTKGLVPGKQVDCIDTRFGNPSLSAIGDRLIYKFSRDRLYVSQTAGGCVGVARNDTLITRQYTGRLCRGDIAQTVSLPSRAYTGSCAMGAFTPYTGG